MLVVDFGNKKTKPQKWGFVQNSTVTLTRGVATSIFKSCVLLAVNLSSFALERQHASVFI